MSALVAHASLDPLSLEVTFSRIVCSDAAGSCMTQRAGLGVIFPCSSAGPWVQCVGLHCLVHLASGLWEREVRRKDGSVSGSPSRSLTLIDCGGAGSVALARDTWEDWVRWVYFCSLLHMAAADRLQRAQFVQGTTAGKQNPGNAEAKGKRYATYQSHI